MSRDVYYMSIKADLDSLDEFMECENKDLDYQMIHQIKKQKAKVKLNINKKKTTKIRKSYNYDRG